MRAILAVALFAVLTSGGAGANPNAPLPMDDARASAKIGADSFGSLFDSKTRVTNCVRLSRSRASCDVQVGRPGGYVDCRFKIYVGSWKTIYKLRARNLDCERTP